MSAIRIGVVGSINVGKTTMLIRFRHGHFPTEYIPSVFDSDVCGSFLVVSHRTKVPFKHNDITYDLQYWDHFPRIDYEKLRMETYKKTDVVLLCFESCYRKNSNGSLQKLVEQWYPEVTQNTHNLQVHLVCTKIDWRAPDFERGEWTFLYTPEEITAARQKLGPHRYHETSALTGEGVTELFQAVIEDYTNPEKAAVVHNKFAKKNKGARCSLM